MVKLILLAKRKPGMSREEFISYYENEHTDLANNTFPTMQNFCKRIRNYVRHDQVVIPEGFSGEVDYDVITESIFEDQESLDRFMQEATNPAQAAPYRDDEANLFDLDSMRFFFVDVHESEIKPAD